LFSAAGAIAGDPQPYQYLVESIRQFHDQRALAVLMEEAGMRHVTYENILNGPYSSTHPPTPRMFSPPSAPPESGGPRPGGARRITREARPAGVVAVHSGFRLD
jgi:hypothetical protein